MSNSNIAKQFSKIKIFLCILRNICSLFSFTFNGSFLFFRVCHSFCGCGTRTTPHYKCICLCLYVHFLSVFLHWCSWWCVMCNMIRDRIRGEQSQHFSNVCVEITHARTRTSMLFCIIFWFMQWYGGFLNMKLENSHAMLPICSIRHVHTLTSVCSNHMGTSRDIRDILISRIIYEAKLGISVLLCLSRSFAFTPSWSCWWIWSAVSRWWIALTHTQTYTQSYSVSRCFICSHVGWWDDMM